MGMMRRAYARWLARAGLWILVSGALAAMLILRNRLEKLPAQFVEICLPDISADGDDP